ncbi:MAG: Crp/Fnr family transcriptional regulator [Bernardetiaceae bacterium]
METPPLDRQAAIHALLSAIVDLPAENMTLPRQAFLVQPGLPSLSVYYVLEGAMRVFWLSEEGEEHTIRFAYPPDVFGDIFSFFDGQPAIYHIQALRKTELRAIRRKDFWMCIESDPQLRYGYQCFLEELIKGQLEREMDLLTRSPALRYARVLTRNPEVFRQIPHKYIAAYLRMSPETLSRLQKM